MDGILPYVGFLIDFFSNGEDILFRVVVDFEFFFLEINIGRVSKISRINYVKFRRGFFDVYIYIYGIFIDENVWMMGNLMGIFK